MPEKQFGVRAEFRRQAKILADLFGQFSAKDYLFVFVVLGLLAWWAN